MFLSPILLVMGVDLLQFLGIWFIKAEKLFSPPRRNRVDHVDSSQSEMTHKKHSTMLAHFQYTPKNNIQDIFSLAACL